MVNVSKKQLETELHHLTVINEFALKLLSLNSVEEITWRLAQDVIAQLGFEDVVIYLYDEYSQTLKQVAAFGNKNPKEYEILDPITLKIGQGVVGKAAKTKLPQLITDTRDCSDYVPDDAYRLSELAVPMLNEGKLIGVIDSEHSQANYYTQQHVHTLESISIIAATKIAKARIIETLQNTVEELEYSSKIQDTLFQIAEIIFDTENMESFYQRLHQCISKLTYAKNFMVGILLPDQSGITFPYSIDEFDDYPDATIPYCIEKPSISGWVVKNNQALLVTDEDLQTMIDKEELYTYGTLPKAWLGVPFGNDTSLRGLVVVQNYTDSYKFTQQDKQLLGFAAKHIRNAIERMQAREELKFLALHDSLTQLPNRSLFNDRIEQAILGLDRNPDKLVAVLFLDLDKFKAINDTYGHQTGDELLIAVANRISLSLRQADTLCRLGGDEFAVLMESLDALDEALEIAQRIVDSVNQPFALNNATINTSTSIGVSTYNSKDITPDILVKQADEAMYQAKSSGRNQVKVFESSMSYSVNEDFAVGLKRAITNNQLECLFQPYVDFSTKKIIGAEALLRWNHPSLGLLDPEDFLPQSHKLGLGCSIDVYVCAQVIKHLKNNLTEYPNHFTISVNISDQGIVSDGLLQFVTEQYKQHPEIIAKLCFEITEKVYTNNIEQVNRHINFYRAMGILVSLDDFGTGYSSLSMLDKLSLDHLKLDQSYIKDIKPGIEHSVILTTIIKLARSLGITIFAEGIENQYQFDQLKLLNCDVAQGFHLYSPMNAEVLGVTLSERAGN